MNVKLIVIWLGFAYATYYYSQRYKANPYLWLFIGYMFSVAGFVGAIFFFRKEFTVGGKPRFALPGYRSRTPWKMAIATVCYLILISIIVIVFSSPEANQ